MKMNFLAWFGIIGGGIGILGAIFAVVLTTGSAGIYISIGMLLFLGGLFYLFYRLFFKAMITASRLQKAGIPGRATILSVADTGIIINQNPQVKLTLEIKNSFGKKYTTECRAMVLRINPGIYKPGMGVPVKIDPDNEMNVALDFSTGSSNGQTTAGSHVHPDEQGIKNEIQQLQKDNEEISNTGRSARAIVKKYTWLGVNVNGQNPYVELEIEVLPENTFSFSASTKGVIAETSVPRYQPGQEIFVKYDFYDNSKVVIDHS